MIKPKLVQAMNQQINAEMYSAYLYLSMSAWLKGRNLEGMANWMSVQAQEEMTHAMKFYNYVFERGGKVVLDTIAAPQREWADEGKVFEEVCAHEAKVTALINKLAELALKEKDFASQNFLQWFVNEQVEEEAAAQYVCEKIKMTSGFPGGLFMMDKELGARVFTPPTAPAEN